jgi:hypothetical protein
MKDSTRSILTDALDEVSSFLPSEVTYSENLSLWGGDGIFDSLALVNFISSVEVLISDSMNKEIMIVSEKAFSAKNSPFKTMETFGAFIEELLTETE